MLSGTKGINQLASGRGISAEKSFRRRILKEAAELQAAGLAETLIE